jgi:hypothetical protein
MGKRFEVERVSGGYIIHLSQENKGDVYKPPKRLVADSFAKVVMKLEDFMGK